MLENGAKPQRTFRLRLDRRAASPAVPPPIGGRVYAAAIVLSAIVSAMLFYAHGGAIFSLPASVHAAGPEDLRVFWRAGQMVLGGETSAIYDGETLSAAFSNDGRGLRWFNPPHALFLVLPLGLLPYGAAKALWLIASAASLLLIARIAAPQSPSLMAASVIGPAAFISLLVMQAGPFMTLLLMGGLLLAERRPVLAGLLLAILTIKPQYGLMAPVFLAARGNWRAFVSAAGFAALLVLASLIAFGADAWRGFIDAVSGNHIALVHRGMVTAAQAAGKLGLDGDARLAVQIAAMLAGAAATYLAARRCARIEAIAVALIASAVASPSFWLYDWAFVGAAFMLLTRAGPWPVAVDAVAAAAVFAPFFGLGAGTDASSIATTATLIASLFAVTHWLVNRPAMRDASGDQTLSGPTRMTALPKFSPWKRPMKAFGASSRPS